MAELRRRAVAITLALGALGALAPGQRAQADMRAANTSTPLAAHPPMGFNNWARFQCVAQAPLDGRDRATYGFQDFMLDQAKALVSTGLARAGYRYVVVDDCWMRRDGDGLHGVARWGSYKHPSGQPGFDDDLTGYFDALHAMGLRGGLYNTAGATTCQRVAAGEAGHQDQDARRYVAWGVDFLKLDNCGADDPALPALFTAMAQALGRATAASPRKILFDESAPAQYAPTDPMKYQVMADVRPLGQMWRIGPDIRITHIGPDGRSLYDPWSFNDAAQGYEEGVYQAYTDAVALSRYVAPGNWNDADQLLIGDGGLTTAEERSQMGLWSMLGAPLILSTDVRKLAREPGDPHFAAALAILTNAAVIAIDQDGLGAGGYRVLRDHSADDAGVDVVAKPLQDGGLAVLVLNKGPVAIAYQAPLAELGVAPNGCALSLTDLWNGGVRRVDAGGALTGAIASHDNLMMRIAPAACLQWRPTGQITGAQAAFASPPLCLETDEDGAVTMQTCSATPGQRWRMEATGAVRLASRPTLCLTGGVGGAIGVASCSAGGATQAFAYHLGGTLQSADGRCLEVDTAKVGAGGLIGQAGAKLHLAACRPFAPEQAFSAPHVGAPAG